MLAYGLGVIAGIGLAFMGHTLWEATRTWRDARRESRDLDAKYKKLLEEEKRRS